MNISKLYNTNKAFTIIELLIVIVIIGVLVAITAVSYTGITKSAKDAALKSELKQISTALELNKAKTGIYPPSLATNTPPIKSSDNANITYAPLNNGTSYSLTATDKSNPDISLVQTPTTSPQQASRPIQTITKANCPTTRTMVRDARDNSTYWIQRLADNQCWMLTNLAYAGGGTNTYGDVIEQGDGTPGTNTINGPDNSGTATFTLAKYYIPPGANPTTEPTAPSTSTSGIGQYGYLYNFCGANGGQAGNGACSNTTSVAVNTSRSICPDGWRLADTIKYTALNSAINGGSTSNGAGITSGPWMGQLSGRWYSGFNNQNSYGSYWSSVQYISAKYSNVGAYGLYYNSGTVNTSNLNTDTWYKTNGRAVRCLAQQ